MPAPVRPYFCEIAYQDPTEVLAPCAEMPFAQLLHSCPGSAGSARYSFIALDPFETFVAKGRDLKTSKEESTGNPFNLIKEIVTHYPTQTIEGLPPFQGGACGVFAYELQHHLEKLPAAEDDLDLPDLVLGFYDVVVAYDHQEKRAWVISSGYPEQDAQAREAHAKERAEDIKEKLSQPHTSTSAAIPTLSAPTSNVDKETYISRVEQAIEHIYAGDIYQANLSQRFESKASSSLNPYALFERLNEISPAPFAAFQNFPQMAVASNSPERFLKVWPEEGSLRAETKPIKGTLPRGKTPAEDKALAGQLLSSEKDRAENTMIVDLLRNDLSRVCTEESVEVEALCALESYAKVHHLVSTITGTLSPERSALDLLTACFPGGSITGAPKIRAMEIISELEGVARGPYCGAIGYLGFDGSMDTNIAIRTLVIPETKGLERSIYFAVGGGIVADSQPEMEYEESLTKATAFLELLGTQDR